MAAAGGGGDATEALIADLARAYGRALVHTAKSWVFNCDSGCFADVCARQVWMEGGIMAIYQPSKGMREYDDMTATVFFKPKEGGKIAKAVWQRAQPALQEIEQLLLQGYNSYLAASGNKWTHAVDGSLKQVAQIEKPLELRPEGSISFKFAIRQATTSCCGDCWEPLPLMERLGMDTSRGPLAADGTWNDEDFKGRLLEDAVPAVLAPPAKAKAATAAKGKGKAAGGAASGGGKAAPKGRGKAAAAAAAPAAEPSGEADGAGAAAAAPAPAPTAAGRKRRARADADAAAAAPAGEEEHKRAK